MTMGRSTPESAFLDAIAEAVAERLRPTLERTPVPVTALSWRERLWTAPAETRLTVDEAAEAIGRPVSWVYRRTSAKALAKAERTALPHRKLDGELTFTAGDLRAWLNEHEAVIHRGSQ